MTKNTGGAAFPEIYEYFEYGNLRLEHMPGMTLRDYFAAKAMQGLCAAEGEGEERASHRLSDRAFTIANAMLKERAKADEIKQPVVGEAE